MSIPVEKRDLADGWVLTCRGADGGDLTLTDLNIRRDNLTCQGASELSYLLTLLSRLLQLREQLWVVIQSISLC